MLTIDSTQEPLAVGAMSKAGKCVGTQTDSVSTPEKVRPTKGKLSVNRSSAAAPGYESTASTTAGEMCTDVESSSEEEAEPAMAVGEHRSPEDYTPPTISEYECSTYRDLKAFAESPAHTRTHKPALPLYCEVCRIAKARNARKYKGQSLRCPECYGDLVTLDHTNMRDAFGCRGLRGKLRALVIYDLGTKFKTFDPVDSMGTRETLLIMQHSMGTESWKHLYSDNWSSYVEAAEILGINHEFCNLASARQTRSSNDAISM